MMPSAAQHESTSAPEARTARARLMDAATRLFCKQGINATGIDAIVHEAGIAKTTLYKMFGSKDDLVEAVLRAEGETWRQWFFEATLAARTPRARLQSIFPVLKDWFAEDGYYGCAFINAVGEHDKSETRLRGITLEHKSQVLSHIGTLAREAGADKPDVLAHQIGLLMDGAIVAAMVTRDATIADAANRAAGALITEACGAQGSHAIRSSRSAKTKPPIARKAVR